MKTFAIIFNFDDGLPFAFALKEFSKGLDERIKAIGPDGYLGKVMAVADNLPHAILFAYADSATPEVDSSIQASMSLIGQAAVAFGGWSLWDSIKHKCTVHELTEKDMPEFYAQLIENLELS